MNLRYFLPAYLCVYFFAAFFWRSYRVWKTTGINPVTFTRSDSAHDFVGRVFKLLFALLVLVVIVYSVFPVAYAYTSPILWLETRWLRWAGVLLLMLSLIWTVLAQQQMGKAWRIGIDSAHRTPLVQEGVFSISRNPIYVGIIVTLCGLFVTIPNALTFLALVLGVVLIGTQVRLEEEHLSKLHSTEYADYRQRVRRWI